LCLHTGQRGAKRTPDPGEIDVDDTLEGGGVEDGHWCHGVDASVGDHDVDAPEMLCGSVHCRLQAGQVAHVGA
jgi:hypothetical protein